MTGVPACYKRTHHCGELTIKNVGESVTLVGWVNKRRDLGGLIFFELRDRYGITQIVFNSERNREEFIRAETVKPEYVIAIKGEVAVRPEGTQHRSLKTGEVEVQAAEISIINTSKAIPFNMSDGQSLDEMLRLRYRYLDLRRPSMVRKMLLRHRTAKAVRDFFDLHDFLEVETPVLVRSTPEGARDYLVPSRVNQGKFYALPQSPQLFKQLLMVAGVDRYFQLARCFRDEDLRADRQPEFTQIDMEMSFATQDDILTMIEAMLVHVFSSTLNIELTAPFLRMTYREAISRFGSDKPDIRFGMEIFDITTLMGDVEFEVFSRTITGGGRIKALRIEGKAGLSRKEIDDLVALAKTTGLTGLITVAYQNEGVKSILNKHMDSSHLEQLRTYAGAQPGDLVVITAGEDRPVCENLGRLRLELANRYSLISSGEFKFLWVLDFPLFKYSEEEKRIEAEHHPFTSAHPDDVEMMESDPLKVRANAYDLVLNGVELGSGSIRIHERHIQERLFKVIGLSEEEAQAKFGFLLNAFEYGAPPHGGIALGFDRLLAIMSGVDSIREVVAFPKNQSAACPMTGGPVEATEEQLSLLKISVEKPQEAR
ncbi:MAG: aspartate--tRNA ligase [Candidatus Xenobiia bacterium LiM19]